MFWDASALVPVLIVERRSLALTDLLGSDPAVALWWATPVECHSALQRGRRDLRLRPAPIRQAVARLAAISEDVDTMDASADVRRIAIRLLEAHPLSAADALQLAAALVWCEEAPSGEGFVCLDERLREAARREGFTVLPG